jgi:accessory colonization factor AcfC
MDLGSAIIDFVECLERNYAMELMQDGASFLPTRHGGNIMLKSIIIGAAMLVATTAPTLAADIHVYGPGGPLPAMKEAAAAFEKSSGNTVIVTAGPTPQWIGKAKDNADLIFSGSETMMSDFVKAMDGQIKDADVVPLYLRPSAILVRPGNPDKITGLADLFKSGHKVLVVNGAGQNGLWEDMAGRTGDIEKVKALRANIKTFAANSAEAKKAWTEDKSFDAWIIWNIWQVANPTLADVVEVEPDYRIYRDTGIVLTERGGKNADAKAFSEFLQGPEAKAIFAKAGWTTPSK